MKYLHNIFEYLIDHRWAREVMYWGGWCVIVFNSYQLPSLPYAMTLLGALLMYFSGLMTGTAMTEKHYEERA